MKNVYQAKDPTHAHLLREILETKGITAVIQDEQTFYLRGEVPTVYPSIWVSDESAETARHICEDFDKNSKNPGTWDSWICQKCGESIGGEFNACWKCAENAETSIADAPPKVHNAAKSKIPKWVLIAVAAAVFVYIAIRSTAHNPEKARQLTNEAVQLMRTGDNTRAIGKLDEAAALNSRSPIIFYNRAIAHGRLHRDDNSIADYTRALELDFDKRDQALIGRARQYFHKAQYTQALEDVTHAIEHSHSAHAYGFRAHLYSQIGLLKMALEDLRLALQIDAHYAYANYLRGFFHFEAGEFDNAEQIAATLIKNDPRNKLGYSLRGAILLVRDQLPDAIAALSRAVELDGTDPTAYCNRGLCHLNKGETAEAIADFSAALALDPKDPFAYRWRAYAYSINNDMQMSRADIEAATGIEPNSAAGFVARGAAWALKGDMTRALKDAQSAREMQPWNCWVDCGIAAIYCRHARALPLDSANSDSRAANLGKAIDYLKSAQTKGLKTWIGIKHDPDLKLLENEPQYKVLLGQPN